MEMSGSGFAPLIHCERCGDAVIEPVEIKGKIYCEECGRCSYCHKKFKKLPAGDVNPICDKCLYG